MTTDGIRETAALTYERPERETRVAEAVWDTGLLDGHHKVLVHAYGDGYRMAVVTIVGSQSFNDSFALFVKVRARLRAQGRPVELASVDEGATLKDWEKDRLHPIAFKVDTHD